MILWELQKLSGNRFVRGTALTVFILAIVFVYSFSASESDALTEAEVLFTVRRVIENAESNYRAVIENSPDDEYALRYQLKAQEVYTEIAEQLSVDENAHGWDIYFGCNTSVLTLLLITFIVPTVFSIEKSTGMMPIMCACKHGRRHTVAAKTITAVIVSVVSVLLINVAAIFVVYIKCGFSSMGYSVQSFRALVYVPYSVSVGRFLLLRISYEAVVASAYGLLLNAVASITYNGLFSSAAGIVFYLFNLLFDLTLSLNVSSPVRVLNLMSASDATLMLTDYNLVHIGNGMMCVSFVIASYSIIALVSALLPFRFSAAKAVNLKVNISTAAIKKITSRCRELLPRYYPKSVFGWEAYKLLLSRSGIVILVLMIVFQCIILQNQYKYEASSEEKYYAAYMQKLEGEYTEEKYESVMSEHDELNSIVSGYADITAAYEAGKITLNEFDEYRSGYYEAKAELTMLGPVIEKAEYLKELKERGIVGCFFADTGVKKVFTHGLNPVLYIAVVICFSSLFSSEYNSNSSSVTTASIIKAARRGRSATSVSKLAVSCIMSVIMSTATFSLELLYIDSVYPIKGADFPILSIAEYGDCPIYLTVGAYSVIIFAVRAVGGVLLSLLMNALSELYRSSVKSVISGILLTGLPAAMVLLFESEALGAISYFDAFDGNGSWGAMLVFTTVILMLTVVSLVNYSRR